MSTAVEEVKPPAYVMPSVGLGQRVLVYSQGTKDNGKQPAIGHVRKVYGRTAVIQTYDGNFYGTIPHITDPRLKDNPDLRQEGAWDYTEDDLFLKQFVEEVTGKISQLERQVTALISKKQ